MWIYSLLILQGLLTIWYFRLFSAYTRVWKEHDTAPANGNLGDLEEVCLLIALRNEAKNLPRLFLSLEKQSYPNLQVIFIDDHSEDASAALIEAFCASRAKTRRLALPQGLNGKKQALNFAMDQVRAPWILCTDADTWNEQEWVASMMRCARERNAVFISGPVAMQAESSWFSRWQALEFSGLIAIGASGIFMDRPTMCNGANLLYQREAFIQVGGFSGNENIASGDDQFLMHRIHEHYPGGVHFCKDQEAIVYTKTLHSFRQFVNQRVRWASKNGQFERKAVSNEMLGVWLLSAFLMMDVFLGFWLPGFFVAFFSFFFAKLLVERQFYSYVLPFFRQTELMKNFWIAELFQVVYVFGIGLLGKFVSYEWKGRIHGRRN